MYDESTHKTYQSGPFTVTENIVIDENGTKWLDLQMILPGRVRVPCAAAGADRAAQLKAERSILRGMLDDISLALEPEDE